MLCPSRRQPKLFGLVIPSSANSNLEPTAAALSCKAQVPSNHKIWSHARSCVAFCPVVLHFVAVVIQQNPHDAFIRLFRPTQTVILVGRIQIADAALRSEYLENLGGFALISCQVWEIVAGALLENDR